MKQIWKRMPMELVISNIMPFAQSPQPKDLQTDIKTFVSSYSLAKDIYFEQFSKFNTDPTQIPEDWIYEDLFRFAHGGTAEMPVYRFHVNMNFINIFKRHRRFKDERPDYVRHFISNIFDINLAVYPLPVRIKILWGLLSPSERERFVACTVIPRDPDSTIFLNFNNYYLPDQTPIIPNVIGVEWVNNVFNNNNIIENDIGINTIQ